MQLVIKYGADMNGTKHDIVVASYSNATTVPMSEFPGCTLIPWEGDLDTLGRVGPTMDLGQPPQMDTRPHEAPTNLDFAAYAALRRYMTETGGITLNGKKVATDRQSQGLITAAWVRAQAAPDAFISFKTADGFVKLLGKDVIALGDAVGDFVQACFQTEADLAGGTGGLTIKKIDAAFAKIPTSITTPAAP